MKEIMDKIVAKLAAMPQDKFDRLLEEHQDDPIAVALREMGEFTEYLKKN